MERLQQVVCGRPAEPEGAVRPEEALPEGGGGPALSLPGEHTQSGSSLQQPCLPSGMEPWALVSLLRLDPAFAYVEPPSS